MGVIRVTSGSKLRCVALSLQFMSRCILTSASMQRLADMLPRGLEKRRGLVFARHGHERNRSKSTVRSLFHLSAFLIEHKVEREAKVLTRREEESLHLAASWPSMLERHKRLKAGTGQRKLEIVHSFA